uniref:Putative ubiquitin activating domain contining protein n=1 Tax=viral metagenome TaxID=1070528 RepID=A0A6M3ISF4_9ZZZZ
MLGSLTDDVYLRQGSLGLYIPKSVTVVGVGGVGFWLGLELAMVGVPQLNLIDPDSVEEHNLNRLPIPKGMIGRAKVDVLAMLIKSLREHCIITKHPYKADSDVLDMLGHEVICDCTDSFRFQRQLGQYCADKRVEYVRAGYDGTHYTVTSNVLSTWDVDEDEPDGYTVVPSFVGSAVKAATDALIKIVHASRMEISRYIHE